MNSDTRREQDRREQDRLVLDHLELADAVAWRFAARRADRDDLRQVARVGLVNAARRFDASRGHDFASFAVPTISGELKRHLRDHGWLVRPPRRLQELNSIIHSQAPALAQRLGHAPTPVELAEHLDESVADVRAAIACDELQHPASLDGPIAGDEGITLGDALGAPEEGHARTEMVETIAAACRTLPPRERRILYLRFFEDRTQQEIAHEIGVTQMQISRVLAKALERLRRAIDDASEPNAPAA